MTRHERQARLAPRIDLTERLARPGSLRWRVHALGAIALVSALLGLNIARGSRTARVLVWMLAFASGAFLILLCAATLLASLAPDQSELGGAFQLLFFGYVALVCATYVVGGCLLVPAVARAYFRRARP